MNKWKSHCNFHCSESRHVLGGGCVQHVCQNVAGLGQATWNTLKVQLNFPNLFIVMILFIVAMES